MSKPWEKSRYFYCAERERVKCQKGTFYESESLTNAGCFSVCFIKQKIFFFGLFLCFEPVSKQPKQKNSCFETDRNKQKNLLHMQVRHGLLLKKRPGAAQSS